MRGGVSRLMEQCPSMIGSIEDDQSHSVSVAWVLGGRPHGSNIFCNRLNLVRPTDSFSATEKYESMLEWPTYEAMLSRCMFTAHALEEGGGGEERGEGAGGRRK